MELAVEFAASSDCADRSRSRSRRHTGQAYQSGMHPSTTTQPAAAQLTCCAARTLCRSPAALIARRAARTLHRSHAVPLTRRTARTLRTSHLKPVLYTQLDERAANALIHTHLLAPGPPVVGRRSPVPAPAGRRRWRGRVRPRVEIRWRLTLCRPRRALRRVATRGRAARVVRAVERLIEVRGVGCVGVGCEGVRCSHGLAMPRPSVPAHAAASCCQCCASVRMCCCVRPRALP